MDIFEEFLNNFCFKVLYRLSILHYRVQLISDELDEIKVRLDTLHNNLEQSAIDNIDDEINRLLAQIRAMDVSDL